MNRAHLGAVVVLVAVVPSGAAQAQGGFGGVVCVGSELERVGNAGPVRTVLQKDVELVYRAAVAFSDRDRIEAGLLEELEQTEVRCEWSEPGNTHVVVVKYTGVIPLDLTIDPDDPRFDGFSVGYGTDWDAAEANARLDARFDTYYDGSGYEVIVRQRWSTGGAQRADAAREAPGPAAPVVEPAGEAAMEPGTVFRDCLRCPEMVVVPAGNFIMGSPPDVFHRVTIGYVFAVGVYEVTFAEWDACLAAGGCGGYRPDDFGWGRGSRPVINVSWEDAREYVQWLSRETGEQYRLLTEAEWEYVARAGTQTDRYWGESETGQCRYANGYDRTGHAEMGYGDPVACSDGYVRTAPVGLFEPNGFGLYDVLGNVRERLQDCRNWGYSGAPADGSAWSSGDCSSRMLRGGSWGDDPSSLRSPARDWEAAWQRNGAIGFRVARTMN